MWESVCTRAAPTRRRCRTARGAAIVLLPDGVDGCSCCAAHVTFARRSFVKIIAGRVKNTGTYTWKLPVDFDTHPYLKVTVSDIDNASVTDQSFPFKTRAVAQARPRMGPVDKFSRSAYNSDFEYGEFVKSVLTAEGRTRTAVRLISSSSTRLTVRSSGRYMRTNRFDPPACVLWDGHDGSFEHWVHWHELEIMDDCGAAPATGVADEGAAAQASAPSGAGVPTGTVASAGVPSYQCGPPTGCKRHPKGHHVFISYRRSDGSDLAGRVFAELERRGE